MTHRSSRNGAFTRASLMLIGAGLVVMTGSSARAATSGPFALLPASAALSDARLATVRGGFDIAPKVTVDFAYRQITSVNGTVIAAIAIPQIRIAFGQGGSPQITPQASQAASSMPTTSAPSTTTASTGSGAATSTNGQIPGTTPIISRYGNTSVSTRFGTGGISTVITNMANDVLIQHHVNVDIGLTGMHAMLASQANAMVISQAMANATQGPR